MRSSILIPMRDEAAALPRLAAAFEAAERSGALPEGEILVVDDGSADGTGDLVADWARRSSRPLVLHRRERPGGLGAALRHGIPHCRGRTVVTYDADLPYPIEDIRGLVEAVEAGADVATASPYHAAGRVEGVPRGRLWPSRAVNALYRLRLGAGARDLTGFTCGFRAYEAGLLRAIAPRHDGFLATAELLVRALRRDARVVERPSVLRGRVDGRSKMRRLRTAWSHLVFLFGGLR